MQEFFFHLSNIYNQNLLWGHKMFLMRAQAVYIKYLTLINREKEKADNKAQYIKKTKDKSK